MFSYTCDLYYRNPESTQTRDGLYIFGDCDLHTLIELLAHSIEYYKSMNYKITKIILYSYCVKCDGNGVIPIHNKRNKLITKLTKCPDCLGKNSKMTIIETDSDTRYKV